MIFVRQAFLFVSILLLGLSYPTGALAAFAATTTMDLVNITADQQTFSAGDQKTLLNGNVVANYQNVKIRGTEATIEMDPATGEPSLATFFKRPTAIRYGATSSSNPGGKRLEDELIADQIQIFLKESAISAQGHAYSYVTTVASNPFTIRADVQEFDNKSKTMVARGQVQVDYKDGKAFSPRAVMQVGPSGKAERVVFSGGARLEQEGSEIQGERITVMVGSGNMIAEKNVQTNIHQEESKANKPPVKVKIFSDYQQYDKVSDTVLASGHVKILYDNYIATGPKATFRLKDGQLDHILITGRGTIIEEGRKITADKITIRINPKHFDAYGNVATQFATAPTPATAEAKPAASKNAMANTSKKGNTKKSPSPSKGGAVKRPTSVEEEWLLEDN